MLETLCDTELQSCCDFRDNNKPINVLTGIDYWLDNLICNVPELVMCFHVNGIVQVRRPAGSRRCSPPRIL